MEESFKRITKILTLILCVLILEGCKKSENKLQNLNLKMNLTKLHTATPRDFVMRLYSLVFTGLFSKEILVECFFEKELKEKTFQVFEHDKKLEEVGCINGFDIFTHAQDSPLEYWSGEAYIKDETLRVPVYFSYGSTKIPYVEISLKKVEKSWLVTNIFYFEDRGKNRGSLKARLEECFMFANTATHSKKQ